MDNQASGNINVGTLNSKILFRKKAVCEYSDEARPYALHLNNDYISSLRESPSIFKKNNNICSNVYDAAHRFGIDKPFKV
jgi:hypothetical protein